jgi:hypothetical protein
LFVYSGRRAYTFAPRFMMALDLRAQAAAETALRLELETELLGERRRDVRSRRKSAADEHLAEQPADLLLLDESRLEFLDGDHTLLDEDHAERARVGARCRHRRRIGSRGQ